MTMRISNFLTPRGVADDDDRALGAFWYVVERTLACFRHFRQIRCVHCLWLLD
jgi:hypothetical protein